jgi:glycosyltransferase involved in cell wall biosynthesis
MEKTIQERTFMELPSALQNIVKLDRPVFSRIAFVGNYLPRQCGIATFTTDLCEAVAKTYPDVDCIALAINDTADGYAYPSRVRYELPQDDVAAYRSAADFLNLNSTNVVCLQHEYGIFGGKAGDYILSFLRELEVPVVTTLHTVLKEPSKDELKVMTELAQLSERLVVMNYRSAEDLKKIYQVPAEKIDFIPHGIPDVPFVDPNFHKDKFGVEGKMVLLTFGLLSPNKGIENVIKALPAIVKQHPKIVYMVVGATHPNIVRRDGESYRESLIKLAQDLGVSENVIFHNDFVRLDELIEFIGAADIYITPYLSPAQSVSGTLAYTLGAGKAVISTPYWYAEETLADGRGLIVPFNDPQAIAQQVLALLNDAPMRHAMRKRAYLMGREMIWPRVAECYMQSFEKARENRQTQPRSFLFFQPLTSSADKPVTHLPAVKIDHLLRLTGDTGIYQHASDNIPNFAEGYTTDDNARALIVALQLDEQAESYRLDLQSLASRYLAFLSYAFDEKTNRCRNFLSFDRRWLEEIGSEDSQGRMIWGLGFTLGHTNYEGLRRLASRMFSRAVWPMLNTNFSRPWAFTLLGIAEYLQRYPGDRGILNAGKEFASRLMDLYRVNSGPDWHWFENTVTYSNASLPQALIQFIPFASKDQAPVMKRIALESLQWLLEVQISEQGYFSAVGNRGFYERGGKRARFDQQPLEAGNMVLACLEAHRLTNEDGWLQAARHVFGWFLGQNDLGLSMYDAESGGCYDGLQSDRANRNEGAESTLAYLQALLALRKAEHDLMHREGKSVSKESSSHLQPFRNR